MTVRHWQTSLRHRGPADPHINSLDPPTMIASAGSMTVTVYGTNFTEDATIEIDQAAKTTFYGDPNTIWTNWDPTAAGTYVFTVRQGEEESNSVPYTVDP